MKTLVRYITLLLVGGVIIPLCITMFKMQQNGATKKHVIKSTNGYSIITNMAAKLLPVIKYF